MTAQRSDYATFPAILYAGHFDRMAADRKRLEQWKAWGGYRESSGGWTCAHYILSGRCAVKECPQDAHLGAHHFGDHAQRWRGPDGAPFILAHLYFPTSDTLRRALAWADRWGLEIVMDGRDAWYGYGTVPVRYERRQPGEAGERAR